MNKILLKTKKIFEKILLDYRLWKKLGVGLIFILAILIVFFIEFDVRWGILGTMFIATLLNYFVSFSKSEILKEMSVFFTALLIICMLMAGFISAVFYFITFV